MKVQPFSFYSLVLGLGLVIALCFFCGLVHSGPPVPEIVLSQEVREVRVFLKTQHFGFYENGRLAFWGPVCSGKKWCETPRGIRRCETPQGKFRVIKKFKGYVSKEYGASMPFAVQFSTSGHFLHVGEIRPKPASHGCVRLTERDAKRIFGLAKKGDPVIITD